MASRPPDPKSGASANSATFAMMSGLSLLLFLHNPRLKIQSKGDIVVRPIGIYASFDAVPNAGKAASIFNMRWFRLFKRP